MKKAKWPHRLQIDMKCGLKKYKKGKTFSNLPTLDYILIWHYDAISFVEISVFRSFLLFATPRTDDTRPTSMTISIYFHAYRRKYKESKVATQPIFIKHILQKFKYDKPFSKFTTLDYILIWHCVAISFTEISVFFRVSYLLLPQEQMTLDLHPGQFQFIFMQRERNLKKGKWHRSLYI